MPPMPQAPFYPGTPFCYPFPPVMPIPYPVVPGPYMYPPAYPPMVFPYWEKESESLWSDSMGSSWEGSVRSHGIDDDGSSSDLWDSQGS